MPKKPIFTSPQEAEAAFYEALERGDLDAMMSVWAEDEEIVCVHPGGPRLNGYALVRDQRRMAVPQGRGEVRFTDVAKLIDPTTVSFSSITDPAGSRVLEQNFQFDLVSAAKLMDRYIGQRIAVERHGRQKIGGDAPGDVLDHQLLFGELEIHGLQAP